MLSKTKTSKKVGVWLDHTKAHLIGVKDGKAFLMETVESPYDPRVRFEGEASNVTRFRQGGSVSGTATSNNEDRKHNRAQMEISAFYNDLETRLKDFDEILLFGPSIAKNQLQNQIASNKAFADKTLALANAENHLRESALLQFVSEFFGEGK